MADQPKFKKAVELTTPKGTFVFPKVNTPDTKFKAEGEYSLKLRLTENDPAAKAFVNTLKPHYDAALVEATQLFGDLKIAARQKLGGIKPNDFYSQVFDDQENPTGDIDIKFTLKPVTEFRTGPNAGKTRLNRVNVFDAKGKPIGTSWSPQEEADRDARIANGENVPAPIKAPAIWSNSTGRVSFRVKPYFVPANGMAGIGLEIMAVQVIELVTSGGARSGAGYGFNDESGGSDGFEGTDPAGDEASEAPGNADF